MDNHLHLFVTGNPEWLIHAGFEARRIFALHASVTRMKDTTYFGELDEWFYKKGGAEALMYYFLHFDWKKALEEADIKDLRLPPVTKELVVQKKQSMSGVKEWANNWVELGEWPYGEVRNGHCYVIKHLLYHDYKKSQLERRTSHIITERQFGIQFMALFPLVVDGKKQYYDNGRVQSVIDAKCKERNSDRNQVDAYQIPPIAELRQVMDFNFGAESDWEEKAEWTVRYASNKIDLNSKELF